jgi:hypothetical protein
MSTKLRRSLTLALLTGSLGLVGTQVPAAAAAEPPPTPPNLQNTTCQVSVLFIVKADPCAIVGSLQEVAAYGLEDVAKELGKDALKNVNLTNVCVRPAHHPTPPPASVLNACPILGG